MHWAKGVTWEAYVLSIIHFAQKHRYFQKLEEHGHQGSAPVNMDADQVFMNHLTNELRRCVREDGDRSDASRLYTLYALDRKKEITNPQTLLDDLALYVAILRTPESLRRFRRGRCGFLKPHRRVEIWRLSPAQ